ncbi:RF-1 domain-containing protein [Amylostereum chailletii]|nr:RF-1 domain-containing protein [Amylostereum chailletii]
MSVLFTPSLQAAARASYRDLWRAARVTFNGDPPVLQAFHEKMRIDFGNLRTAESEDDLRQRLNLNKDVANFLRRNVVQAERQPALPDPDSNDTWKIRLTEHSELGDNELNRVMSNPPDPPSSRRQRKQEKQAQSDSSPPSNETISVPRFYSQLKKAHKDRQVPELKEEDLEESFVRGSGPGGQSINKTQNNVQLTHKPTGLRVTCQETRSLETNRMLARRHLLDKVQLVAVAHLTLTDDEAAGQNQQPRFIEE